MTEGDDVADVVVSSVAAEGRRVSWKTTGVDDKKDKLDDFDTLMGEGESVRTLKVCCADEMNDSLRPRSSRVLSNGRENVTGPVASWYDAVN